jgi:hypothetical protein
MRESQTAAIVMEFVEGPTLADRIAQGPIPAQDKSIVQLLKAERATIAKLRLLSLDPTGSDRRLT